MRVGVDVGTQRLREARRNSVFAARVEGAHLTLLASTSTRVCWTIRRELTNLPSRGGVPAEITPLLLTEIPTCGLGVLFHSVGRIRQHSAMLFGAKRGRFYDIARPLSLHAPPTADDLTTVPAIRS